MAAASTRSGAPRARIDLSRPIVDHGMVEEVSKTFI